MKKANLRYYVWNQSFYQGDAGFSPDTTNDQNLCLKQRNDSQGGREDNTQKLIIGYWPLANKIQQSIPNSHLPMNNNFLLSSCKFLYLRFGRAMNPPLIFCLFLMTMLIGPGLGCFAAEVRIGKSCVARFVGREEGIATITQRDSYTAQLSRFDLQVRLSTERNVTIDDWARFVAGEVEEWSAKDCERISLLLDSVRRRIAKLALPLPHEILLVATTGKEESNAAYCRGAAIALPQQIRAGTDTQLESLLIHELFHVISNQNPQLKASLYRLVGFELCEPLAIHPSLRDRRITNPDAPHIDCVIELVDGNRAFHAAPILYASTAQFDPKKLGLFGYLEFRLMVLEKVGDQWKPADKEGRAVVVDPKKSRSFQEKTGGNTSYIIHPEEILADNFVHMVLERPNLATPQIVIGLRKVLAGDEPTK